MLGINVRGFESNPCTPLQDLSRPIFRANGVHGLLAYVLSGMLVKVPGFHETLPSLQTNYLRDGFTTNLLVNFIPLDFFDAILRNIFCD